MKSKLPLIIIAAIVIVAIAVVLYVFVFSGEKEIPIVRTEFSPGDYFVINLKESPRLLKTTIVLELNTDTLEEYMTEQASIIRDTISTILRNQTEETMRAIDLTGVKKQIQNALNERLEIDNITDILITDIAVQ